MSGASGMRAVGAMNGSSANKPLQVLVRKRPAGRIRKWMGDLSLQVFVVNAFNRAYVVEVCVLLLHC
jgi:hypothetical protein